MAIVLPSYRHMARGPWESKYPGLRHRARALYSPALGVTGNALRDVSDNNINLTLENMEGSDWQVGHHGRELQFGGTDEQAAGPASFAYGGAITLWAFFKPNVLDSTDQYVLTAELGTNERVQMYIRRTSDTVRGGTLFNGFSRTAVGALTLVPGNYYSTVLTVMEGTDNIKAYFNGVPDGTATVASAITGDFDGVRIGNFNGGSNWARISVVSCGVWSRILSTNEINLLGSDPLAPFQLKRRVFIDEPPIVGGNEGAAMYHHLQNIGAY